MADKKLDFEKLLKRKVEIERLFDKSVSDLKYIFVQQHKYETDLMKSYYFEDDRNLSNVVAKCLSRFSDLEKKSLISAFEDSNKDRRLYSDDTSKLVGKSKNFSATWADATFQKALTKCRNPSNSRHSRKILKNNTKFLQLTGIDQRVLVDFFNDNFFFVINLCLWVFKTEKIF